MIYWSSWELKQFYFLLEMQFHTVVAAAAVGEKGNISLRSRLLYPNYTVLFRLFHTSGVVSSLREAFEPETDFSEVLLALDLMEDLLELFGISI